jgi:transcriptional regulator GlxA family with amidase domain
MSATRTVAVLLFPEVEVLDFAGPFEVFSVATRWADPPAFNVCTVAEKMEPVAARNGLSVNPRHRLSDCPPIDLLVVPGGLGTRKEMNAASGGRGRRPRSSCRSRKTLHSAEE